MLDAGTDDGPAPSLVLRHGAPPSDGLATRLPERDDAAGAETWRAGQLVKRCRRLPRLVAGARGDSPRPPRTTATNVLVRRSKRRALVVEAARPPGRIAKAQDYKDRLDPSSPTTIGRSPGSPALRCRPSRCRTATTLVKDPTAPERAFETYCIRPRRRQLRHPRDDWPAGVAPRSARSALPSQGRAVGSRPWGSRCAPRASDSCQMRIRAQAAMLGHPRRKRARSTARSRAEPHRQLGAPRPRAARRTFQEPKATAFGSGHPARLAFALQMQAGRGRRGGGLAESGGRGTRGPGAPRGRGDRTGQSGAPRRAMDPARRDRRRARTRQLRSTPPS